MLGGRLIGCSNTQQRPLQGVVMAFKDQYDTFDMLFPSATVCTLRNPSAWAWILC